MGTTKRTRFRVVPDKMSTAVRNDSEGRESAFVYDVDINQFVGRTVNDWEEVVTNTGGFRMVSSISDFPEAVDSVITLEADVTYFITNTVDLQGARLVGSSNTTIIGGSSENCILTSTGLDSGTALFTTEWTTPIRHIAFKDVGTAISISGSANSAALDWTGVNFVNVPTVGTINGCENFILSKSAFLNSKGLTFTGTCATIGIDNSLFSGDGAAGDLLIVDASANITRRFRIIYSAVVAFSSTNGLNVSTSATIPNEAYILDTVSFSGGSTYLVGVQSNSNKALFTGCTGIANSADVSQYYMNNNATATVVSVQGTAYKVAGTTTSASVTQKFTNTDNRATYVGALTRFFKVTATLSANSGNNNQIGIYVAKNGSILTDSEIYITTNASGRAEAATVQTLVQLTENDYIEIFVENDSSTTNITVTDLNVIVE